MSTQNQPHPEIPERNNTMTDQSFTTTYVVDQTPDEVFAAITNVRGWWSGEIEGDTDQLGAEFSYRHEDIHYSKQRITELIPGQKITWHIVDATLTFADDPHEWIGTNVTFEIARKDDRTEVGFTHHGLVPDIECYEQCSHGWDFFINGALRNLITTGHSAPTQTEDRVGP
jgi:uncharacterized protein YndB with AHSA1/START domain